MKNEIFVIFLIFVIGAFVGWSLSGGIVSAPVTGKTNGTFSESDAVNYWSCMDGCSNMQEIIFGKEIYRNDSQKALHDECAKMCDRQYFNK